jgi:hypothetical protein
VAHALAHAHLPAQRQPPGAHRLPHKVLHLLVRQVVSLRGRGGGGAGAVRSQERSGALFARWQGPGPRDEGG